MLKTGKTEKTHWDEKLQHEYYCQRRRIEEIIVIMKRG